MNKDIINNWYEKTKDKLNEDYYNKKPIGYEKHHILNNSMICAIGGTGCGKTNALFEYIIRSNGNFYEIIIYSGSTTDEKLYNYLSKLNKNIKLFDNINDVPELTDYDNDGIYGELKKYPKLIVFDDFINLKKNEQIKIKKYLTSGRKYGFSVWLMAQNYTQIDKNIIRNCNYFILYKLNDNFTINNIIRNHNIDNLDKNIIINMYNKATDKKLDFFMLDLKGDKELRYRHNFLDLIDFSTKVPL